MQHAVTITLNTEALSNYTDTYLATLWHVAQANPAPIEDREAGELAESVGREIIRRFLANTQPELWAHQGRHHYWTALTEYCRVVDGQWTLKTAAIPAVLASTVTTPNIGTEWPEHGGIYAGIVRGENGAPDYHLVLLAGDAENITWDQAKDFAAKAGGELPSRREQALLYANLKEEFQPTWYWSCEQHASASGYAWGQDFYYGYQYCDDTDDEFRARAVRRLAIQ